jgi:N-acyl-D-amino-acid deacylase
MLDSRFGCSVASLVMFLALTRPSRGQVPFPQPQMGLPATGKAAAVLKPVDTAVASMLTRHGIPGAALAMVKDGKLVCARGYGWANLASRELVQPDTAFGVASLSKTITAVAILKLVEEGKLGLDDKAFKILDQIKPLRKGRLDPRLYEITVRQLLNHSGGWDHQKSGDPVNWTTKLHVELGQQRPVTAGFLISYVMGLPLDFAPGTASKYSNFGYIVLGEVIARVSGQTYERYVQDHVLIPMGVRASLHPVGGGYFVNEAHRYLAGSNTELPAWHQQYSDAAGGWSVSAVQLARFLAALDGSRYKPFLSKPVFEQMIARPLPPMGPRPNGTYVGLGWDSVIAKDRSYGYFKDGMWFGMRSFMKRLPSGLNWVLLMNASVQPDDVDTKLASDAVAEVRKMVESQEKLPDIDLFANFR